MLSVTDDSRGSARWYGWYSDASADNEARCNLFVGHGSSRVVIGFRRSSYAWVQSEQRFIHQSSERARFQPWSAPPLPRSTFAAAGVLTIWSPLTF